MKQSKGRSWLGGLPRRDLIKLPLIAAITFGLLVGISVACELAARRAMPALPGYPCQAMDEADGSSHGIPYCKGEAQAPGTPRVTYSYNECGYRNPSASCGPKPIGAKRVVVLGASFALAVSVPNEKNYIGRLEPLLSKSCGQTVEFQNMGAIGNDLVGSWRDMDEALGLRPDLIIFATMTPDFAFPNVHAHVLDRNQPIVSKPQAQERSYIAKIFSNGADNLRIQKIIRDFNYQDSDYYVKLYLNNHNASDFLWPHYSAEWQQKMDDYDLIVGEMAEKSQAAGVPFAILFTPSRAQAAILGGALAPAGIDPYELPRRISEIATKHGAIFIDTTPDIAKNKKPERLYFALDGHPNEIGYGVIAQSIANTLTKDQQSPFAGCKVPDMAAN